MSLRARLIQMTPRFLVRIFAGPYIAGNSLTMALAKADELYQTQGLHSTLDLLGEGIQNEKDIEFEVEQYLQAIEAIGKRDYVTLSLKPTQMGLSMNPELCKRNLERLLAKATPLHTSITIDMEDAPYTDATLSLYRELRPHHPYLGTVLQSRLFRTQEDIPRYLEGLQAHIRLCLGIYPEGPDIAYQKKPEMKENFHKLLGKLWDAGHFVAIATHDEALLERCLQLAKDKDISTDRYEVQMLLGVPRKAIQQKIVQEGITVRLYVPYATTWDHAYAYAKRRLVENPRMALYVTGNLVRRFFNLFRSKRSLPPSSTP
ncbi:MAG: proline dehydrogenase family protein [Myxococcales bacterium]|nr:proline dehydrogenase family protein [Myxococcales bacterium]